VQHMLDPRATSPGSIMPAYPHLAENRVDFGRTRGKLMAMQTLGVPYSDAEVAHAERDARAEAAWITQQLEGEAEVDPASELVALVAYLQRLGRATPRYRAAQQQEGGESPIEVSAAGGEMR